MTDKKISELTSNGTLNGSELVELVQSGSNVKALLSAIKTFITTGYLTSSTASSTYQTQSGMSSYLTSSTASSTYQTQSGMSSYSTTTALNNGLLSNLTPTINTQTGTSYTVGTVGTDNDGKTILRMTSASANAVTIPSTLTLPISIRQAGTGTSTLQAGSGVTLNGTLAFTAQHQTKTIYRVSSGVYDVVG